MQQRHSCFLPYSSLQFFSLPGRKHSSCVSPQLFIFFLINSTSSCVSRMILLAVCTSNFFHAIFLCMVRVLYTAFGTCLLSSTGFPVVSKFLTFEASQGSWDVTLNSLNTIADLHLVGSTRFIKC